MDILGDSMQGGSQDVGDGRGKKIKLHFGPVQNATGKVPGTRRVRFGKWTFPFR